MELNMLFYLALILLSGLLFGRIVKLIKLPNVTGYLLAGLLIGPHVLGIIPADIAVQLELVSEMALAFIAFTIGLSFKKSYFKAVGFTPVVIAIFEAMVAVFLVQGMLVVTGNDLSFSLVLGAIAAATAPAATIMVIKQYRAKGPVTSTLMSVVAIDDAVALIAFGFSVAIAKALNNPGAGIASAIFQPFKEILFSVLIGAAVGLFIKVPMKFFKKSGNRLVIIIGCVFLTSALASIFGASELLACMIAGTVFCNISSESDSVAELSDFITPPLFLMFFVVSGAELDLSVLPQIGLIGIVYVVFRVLGKVLGSFVGAKIMKAPKEVCRYLGPTLIPQAGVAIGLTIVAQTAVPEYAGVIRTVILCGTLLYEIFGPVITKISLKKAGEIKEPASGKQ